MAPRRPARLNSAVLDRGAGHDQQRRGWSVTAFATSRPLEPAELDAAPVRYPRPSALLQTAEGRRRQGPPGRADAVACTRSATCSSICRATGARRGRWPSSSPARAPPWSCRSAAISSRPVRRRGMRPLVEATVADASGPMKATFFNQPWLVQRYPPGTRLMLHGKLQGRNRFSRPGPRPHDRGDRRRRRGRALPGHRRAVLDPDLRAGREHADEIAVVFDPLSVALRGAERLAGRADALCAVHFPASASDSDEGRRRLAFDELLLAQLALLRRRGTRDQAGRARCSTAPRELTARWLAGMLPFALTGDQERALEAIDADLARARPMQRLLMGEVGSGKTVVALYALLRAVEHGYQGALMAPTETLAEQHFATIQSLMPGEAVPAGLLTGSTPGAAAAPTCSASCPAASCR